MGLTSSRLHPHVMIDEKKFFSLTIKNLKTPSNYVRPLRRRAKKDGKLRGLKSYDYHIMMQHVLPLHFHILME